MIDDDPQPGELGRQKGSVARHVRTSIHIKSKTQFLQQPTAFDKFSFPSGLQFVVVGDVHCFYCKKNLNNIDLLRLLDYAFVDVIALRKRLLEEYQARVVPPPTQK